MCARTKDIIDFTIDIIVTTISFARTGAFRVR